MPAFAEAIVRGHRGGLLTVPDYNNLTQCEALDDIKLNLVCTEAPAALQRQQQWNSSTCTMQA
jgi:V-type H+-transporting ATPase subunit d